MGKPPFSHQVLRNLMEGPLSDAAYFQVVGQWHKQGQQGPKPGRGERKVFDFLAAFGRLFPNIKIEFPKLVDLPAPQPGIPVPSLEQNQPLVCRRDGSEYRPSNLSDGEKEVFCGLLELMYEVLPDSLFLVDEPELHLHPLLALAFWREIEERHPQGTFVYATHSIQFAMRPEVDTRIVLSGPGHKAPALKSLDEPPDDHVREFLGAIPDILKAGKALATEGERTGSIDETFYRWVLGEPDAEIAPLGSCSSVLKAVKHADAWKQIAPSATIHGIIDRDYRSDKEIDEIQRSCAVTRYHHAESYLCEPRLIADLSARLGTSDRIISADEAAQLLKAHCATLVNEVAAQRAMQAAGARDTFSFSMDTAGFGAMSREDVIKALQRTAERKLAEIHRLAGDAVKEAYNAEWRRCRIASQGDCAGMLELFPVKPLLGRYAELLGCADERALVRAASKELRVDDYPSLRSLRESLLRHWL